MSDIAIKVEGLGKRYRIGAKQEKYRTLRDTITNGALRPFRAMKSLTRRNGHSAFSSNSQSAIRNSKFDTIWALKDVSFEVKRGEVVGIIGRNGAGKSTLLKILSRITEPTEGYADINGRVASLLEVGTGFHPELTGRENIYLNGSILGMKRAEIQNKFDKIAAFAEIEKFIDTPVKHYSSGMYVRLAFAVAAHLEPEILLVDEVLAVGDVAFQKKCLGKMGDLAREGRTVLFISHNMHATRSLCSRAILLNTGRIVEEGATEAVVSAYLLNSADGASSASLHRAWEDIGTAPGNEKIRVRKVHLIPDSTDSTINMDTPLRIEIEYWSMLPNTKLFLDLCLYSLDGSPVFDSMTAHETVWDAQQFPRGLFRSTCWIPGNLLNEGNYRVRIAFIDDSAKILCDQEEALVFAVHDSRIRDIPWYGRFIGFVHPKFEWKTQLLELENEHASL